MIRDHKFLLRSQDTMTNGLEFSYLAQDSLQRSMINELEELLQPEAILRHEDEILQNGKVLRKYLIKFKLFF